MIMLFIVSGGIAFAQDIAVSGLISDSQTKEPIIGASIAVKGTTTGTFSDENGRYSLNVPRNGIITVSFLGYFTQELRVTGSVLNVVLENQDFEVEDIVIVGTVMKKGDLTGAVSGVSGKVLQERPVTSINQALQGRVAGVFINPAAKPGDDSSIKIRGINTIDGKTDPIYVVDGLVMDNYGGGFNSVNLNDVASIEVLKDASATALYGSRAANGVVLITTKKGSKGKGKVNYDGWVGFRSYAKRPKTMNSKQLFELRRDAAMNSFMARHPNATEAEINDNMQNRIMNAYNPHGGGGYVFGQYELDAYNNPNFKDYDWLDEVTRNAVEHNHVLSFTGGNESGTYYLSLGYANQEGMVKKLGSKTYTGRINADYNIKPWLKVGTNTSYIRTESQIQANDDVFDKARGANPMLPIDYDLLTLNYGDYNDENYFNPLGTLRIKNDRVRNRIISSNFLNINPIKGLNIRTTFAINSFEESTFRYQPNDIQQAIRYSNHGEAEHKRDNMTTWQWDNTVSYDNIFGVHRINALIGTSASKSSRNYTNVIGRGFDSNLFGYHNIGASEQTGDRRIESDFYASSLLSYFVRANYTYADKYYLTATARYDGSSKFAQGNRWGLFPSFSAAWNITQEDFMKDVTFFDQLKLRAGYGIVGNQEIDNYSFLTLYKPSVSNNSTVYIPDSKQGTSDINWESQRQFNIGLDMSFLNNRVKISADYFDITNSDLLMTRTVAESSGFKTAVVNIGEIKNRGVEFTVDVNAIKTKDLEWNVSANFSRDRNKVTKLFDNVNHIFKYDDWQSLQKEGNLFLGESRNTIYIWKTGGIAQVGDMDRLNQINWQGKNVGPGDLYPLDISGVDGKPDGKIDENDRVIVGSPDPKFYGGFSTDISYKGISLNAVFNYSYGAKKLSYLYESLIGSNGRGLASVDLLDRWTPENTDAKFPRPMLQDGNDGAPAYNPFTAGQMDFSVQKASYLRLSTLTLAYNFPKKIVNSLKLDNLRVYSTASNLFCLTPYKGYDPETGDWYPPTKMFVLGLNVSF
ncbi:TonB-dependent receptor [Dysgonomonas sp. 521]|uniref:SusC/RagA family TonB-linked outer membrane protein n=1 Tax=Dysgonomonas sp. 521 TaxID=2302932 RepID=UPI0013D14BA9|nr:TonB-dependent receptor [Dysgonomonas sp. 521]NDV93951.1 TonB-dependent receptor [Dysgonomonas sp. 521]